jgi:hypothetical protein
MRRREGEVLDFIRHGRIELDGELRSTTSAAKPAGGRGGGEETHGPDACGS